MFEICEKCKTPFVEPGAKKTTQHYRYVFVMRLKKGDMTLELDKWALCSDCGDLLYKYMMENGMRPLSDVDQDGIPDTIYQIVMANPELKDGFQRIVEHE